jgi:hypothetical protein
MYRRKDADVQGPTLTIHQVDNIMVFAEDAMDRKAILDGIASCITFKISPAVTTLFYATDIEQTALHIRVHARSYITSCLTKLGSEADAKDSSFMASLPASSVK